MNKITREEFMMGRDSEYPTSEAFEMAAAVLLWRVNRLLIRYCSETRQLRPGLASGYRPGHYNTMAKGSPNSAHLSCQAVDLADSRGNLNTWITDKILKEFDLYREDPKATPTWCHLQTRPATVRTFKP